jgi:hypothetical protein
MKTLHFAFLIIAISLVARGDGELYTVKGKLVRNEKATVLRVELQTISNAQINQEAPVILELGASEGLRLERSKFSREDFSVSNKKSMVFECKAEEQKEHKPKVEGRIMFYLCSKSACKKIDHCFSVQ